MATRSAYSAYFLCSGSGRLKPPLSMLAWQLPAVQTPYSIRFASYPAEVTRWDVRHPPTTRSEHNQLEINTPLLL